MSESLTARVVSLFIAISLTPGRTFSMARSQIFLQRLTSEESLMKKSPITLTRLKKFSVMLLLVKLLISITISVRDENGELFDFEGLPLEFELEIN